MTSRSEISASPPPGLCCCPLDILWLCRERSWRRTWCLGARGTCVMSIVRSSGKSHSLSLCLFYFLLLFLCACLPATWDPFLVILYAKTCVCVCVWVFSKHFRWAGCSSFAWRLSAFAQCTVYALLVHQHVLYDILMLTLQATEPFFVSVCCCCCFVVALWRLLCLLCWTARSLRIKYTQRLTCCLPVN